MPTEDTRTPGSPRRFWAVLCNPDRYRFDEDYQNRTESVWTVPRGDVHAGDGLLIWRAQGKNQSPRGIVAIATVLTEPEEFSEPEEFAQYWVNPQVPSAARRIWVRYERYTGLPLLLGGPHHQLLEQLTVSRAQGSGAFQITEQQWLSILQASGAWQAESNTEPTLSAQLDGWPEGTKKLVLHWRIERSAELVRRRKQQALDQHHHLNCECCDFNFADAYGPYGTGFIECHHRRPLHTLTESCITSLDDLALVCSNCHRMLHRIPDCTVETLRTLIAAQRNRHQQ